MSCRQVFIGDFIDATSQACLRVLTQHYLLVEAGRIVDLVAELPADWRGAPTLDYTDQLIIPPFVDAHCHAAQYNNVGLGMDMALLDWLDNYTFPEERRFENRAFCEATYKQFINALWQHGSLASVCYASIHPEGALLLAELFDQSGLRSYVGKVNMDQNSPLDYIESTEQSIADTKQFVDQTQRFARVKPIITPRFAPSCSAELLEALGEIAKTHDLLTQSHLSENPKEIAWVADLFTESTSYSDVYDRYGLIRTEQKTIMAHGIWLSEAEKQLLIDKQVIIAHCPYSNGNLTSGIAPIAELLDRGLPVLLGSDISAGHEMFMGKVMQQAAIFSNLYYVHVDRSYGKLSFEQLFYLATKAGGQLFGDLGDFSAGNWADFLVVGDSHIVDQHKRSPLERLQRFIYCGDGRQIKARYIEGKLINRPFDD